MLVEAEGLIADNRGTPEFAFRSRKILLDLSQILVVSRQVKQVGDALQRIIDLMGNRRSQAADGGQLLGLQQRSLRLVTFRYV